MANHLQRSPILHSDSLTTIFCTFSGNPTTSLTKLISPSPATNKSLNFRTRCRRGPNGCAARRRVRYDDEDEDDSEDYGHNEQIALLESYTQAAADEALVVHAEVDGQLVEVLIFKVFVLLRFFWINLRS